MRRNNTKRVHFQLHIIHSTSKINYTISHSKGVRETRMAMKKSVSPTCYNQRTSHNRACRTPSCLRVVVALAARPRLPLPSLNAGQELCREVCISLEEEAGILSSGFTLILPVRVGHAAPDPARSYAV